MMKHLALSLLSLVAAGSLRAAGVDWSYDGKEPYQAALIVWTDTGINHVASKKDISDRRDLVLATLADPTKSVTLDDLKTLCRQTLIDNVILVDVTTPASQGIRVNHLVPYAIDRTGWGFSLLLNFDANEHVTEYAINEVTSATIKSEAIKDTKLVIHDTDLTSGFAASALTRLRQAGSPCIADSETRPGLINDSATPMSRAAEPILESGLFCFDVTNAVSGFTYHVSASNDLSMPFVRTGIDVFASVDGRLGFEIPIDPSEKVKFYRVTVADTAKPATEPQ